MFKIKKILLIFGLLSLPLLLSACSQNISNQISSNGFVLYSYTMSMHESPEDFEHYIYEALEDFENASEEELKEAGLEGVSKEEYLAMMLEIQGEAGYFYELCDDEDELDDDTSGYETLYSLCLKTDTEIKYHKILYNASKVIDLGSMYEYSLKTFLDVNEIGLTPSEGDELIEGIEFELLFDGEIVYSDLDNYTGNKVSFSVHDLREAFEGNNNPVIRAKKGTPKDSISFTSDDFTRQISKEIKNNGDVYITYMFMNQKIFNVMKNTWNYKDSDFARLPFCEHIDNSEPKDFCGVSNNSIIMKKFFPKEKHSITHVDGDGFRRYNLANLILTFSDFDSDEIKGDAEYYIREKIELVLIFENNILSSDAGLIRGNSLILKGEDINSINKNSSIKVSSASILDGGQAKLNANNNPNVLTVTNKGMYNNLKGKILLQVESKGEAYYVSPVSQEMYFLGKPEDAFAVMRAQGVGISNADLAKIPISLSNLSGIDSDNDGLPDALEVAIGTNPNNPDSDGDSYSDYEEILNGYNPLGTGKISYDHNFTRRHGGKIFLQVERNGEAWYINPDDNKRYFLGRPSDSFNIMRNLGLGISNSNLNNFKK